MNRSCLSSGVMSASAVTSTERCEQLAYFQYEYGWQSKAMGKGLKTGLSMHDGEEMYLHSHNEIAVINSLEEEAKSKGWDEDELFLPKLRAYVKGYYEAWECIDAAQLGFNGDMELLGTECDFDFEMEGIKFTGRIEAVWRDTTNDCIVLMEHKNVSSKDCQSFTSLFWRSLVMNNQATIYSTALALKYGKPVKLWYDVVLTSPLSKPNLKPGKTVNKVKQPRERETIEEFEERLTKTYKNPEENKYVRRMIPVLEHQREKRMKEIVSIAQRAQGIGYLGTPTRNTTSCKDYGGCAFFNVCVGDELIYDNPKFEIKPHFKEENKDGEQPF